MARRKHYKNEPIIKLLVILAGIIGLIWQLIGLLRLAWRANLPRVFPHWYEPYYVIILIIGIIISILTILCGLRRESKSGGVIIPFHWISFLILAILMIIFGGGIIAFILLIIAMILALLEDLDVI